MKTPKTTYLIAGSSNPCARFKNILAIFPEMDSIGEALKKVLDATQENVHLGSTEILQIVKKIVGEENFSKMSFKEGFFNVFYSGDSNLPSKIQLVFDWAEDPDPDQQVAFKISRNPIIRIRDRRKDKSTMLFAA